MDIETVIIEIETDIKYFKALGFEQLVSKFERDLKALKESIKTNKE